MCFLPLWSEGYLQVTWPWRGSVFTLSLDSLSIWNLRSVLINSWTISWSISSPLFSLFFFGDSFVQVLDSCTGLIFFTLSFLLSPWWQPWRWVFLSRKNLPLKCKDCKLIDSFKKKTKYFYIYEGGERKSQINVNLAYSYRLMFLFTPYALFQGRETSCHLMVLVLLLPLPWSSTKTTFLKNFFSSKSDATKSFNFTEESQLYPFPSHFLL